jgi:hypothetical protein
MVRLFLSISGFSLAAIVAVAVATPTGLIMELKETQTLSHLMAFADHGHEGHDEKQGAHHTHTHRHSPEESDHQHTHWDFSLFSPASAPTPRLAELTMPVEEVSRSAPMIREQESPGSSALSSLFRPPIA